MKITFDLEAEETAENARVIREAVERLLVQVNQWPVSNVEATPEVDTGPKTLPDGTKLSRVYPAGGMQRVM